nr:hypothetical protein [Candidatus Cyanaurora vandensis]
MLVLGSKLVATPEQFALIDEAIRSFQFICNKAYGKTIRSRTSMGSSLQIL